MPYNRITPKRFAETLNECLNSGMEVLIMGHNDKLLKTYQPRKIISVEHQYWEHDKDSVPLELYRDVLRDIASESTKVGRYEKWEKLQRLKKQWEGMSGVIIGDSLFFDGKFSKETLVVKCSGNKVFRYSEEICGINIDGTPNVFGWLPDFYEERYNKYDISAGSFCGYNGAKICKLI